MRARLGRLACALALGAGAIAPATAHLVYGQATLRILTAEAELVVRARVTQADARVSLAQPRLEEAVVVAEVLEVLKGAPLSGALRFSQHGHGVAEYADGEEVVVFLLPIEKSRELARTPLADHVRWVSRQETGDRYPLDDATRTAFVAAVRGYAELATLADAAARLEALRHLTVGGLASSDPRLAFSALSDLVLLAELPLVTPEDLPVLSAVLGSGDTPIGIRIGLLAELERRRLVEGPPRWTALLKGTSGSERIAVTRAARLHPSPPVTALLLEDLEGEDRELAVAAAISLGTPGNDAVVPPLARRLDDPLLRMRLAAIRALGAVGTASATQALANTAQQHPDPTTRRRAAAEVKLLQAAAGSAATPVAP